MKRRIAPLAALVLACVVSPALAAPGDDVAEQSRAYFETGAKEYEKGNYPTAIRAFEQAYTLTKRPGLLFSIAQSYRRQYANDSKASNLRKALEHYRHYLAEDKTSKRRGEAATAITDIEAMLARLPAEEQASAQAPEAALPTQISITTQADDATLSIDGAAPRPLEPVEVTPGKHKVVLSAPGYFPEERDVPVNKGQMTALDVQLRPMPARVSIKGHGGAEVRVDGIPLGSLPLVAPLEVESGDRTITLSMNGFVTATEERTVARGEAVKWEPKLARTNQRVASFVLFGTGLVSAGSGILLALGAAEQQNEALRLEAQRKKTYLTADDYQKYEDALRERDRYSVGSTVLLNGGIALGALAFLLYYFDEPKLTPPRAKKDQKKTDKPKEPSPGMRDIALLPIAGPGLAGVSFSAQF
jgi:hypothetical protein